MKVRSIYLVAFTIAAIGIAIFLIKLDRLGLPLAPNQDTAVWTIEARARFLLGEFPRRRSRPFESATIVTTAIAPPAEPPAVVVAIGSQAVDRADGQIERRDEKEFMADPPNPPSAPAVGPSFEPPPLSVEPLSRPTAIFRRWIFLRRPRFRRPPAAVEREGC